MKIAAIADIHGNLAALDAVLRDIEARGVDVAVDLGDSVSGPLWPAETADRLQILDLPSVRGNHDRQLLEDETARMGASDAYAASVLADDHLPWLEGRPRTLWLRSDVPLCHGTPDSDIEYFLEEIVGGDVRMADVNLIAGRAGVHRASLILCGHSHRPGAIRLPDGRLVVNPGSVGLQAYHDVRPCPHTIATGSPDARYAVLEDGGEGWRYSLISVAYDWRPAARLAAERGRPDLACALATGQVSPA